LMINMITTALDVAIMTGIVLFVAFGLTLRRDDPHRGSFE
jgi:energy-converting hydrogenase Eha subunit A